VLRTISPDVINSVPKYQFFVCEISWLLRTPGVTW